MSPQIQDPELAERLRRKFAIVGSSSIDTIAPELVGVVVVDELLPVKERFEQSATTNITADTNDIPEIELANLDAENALVIDRFDITTNAGAPIVRFRHGVLGGTRVGGPNTHNTDMRNPFVGGGGGVTSAVDLNTAGQGTIIWQAKILANTAITVFPNFVLDVAGALDATVARDVVHWDSNLPAQQLIVAVFFHMVPRGIVRR